jgi:hypothetical protein
MIGVTIQAGVRDRSSPTTLRLRSNHIAESGMLKCDSALPSQGRVDEWRLPSHECTATPCTRDLGANPPQSLGLRDTRAPEMVRKAVTGS